MTADEWEKIEKVGDQYGIDPFLLVAIRRAENGGPGKEFGVVSRSAPTYMDQLLICAKTVRTAINEYRGNPYVLWPTDEGYRRLAFSDPFITQLARRYAPVGAANDLADLNENWRKNVSGIYYALVTKNQRGEVV